MSEAPKRIYPKKVEANLVINPDAQTLISDALSIIATEIVRFKHAQSGGKKLEASEARVLQGYIKSLVELAREEREQEESRDFADLTNSQLIKNLLKQMPSEEVTKLLSSIGPEPAKEEEPTHGKE